MAAVRKLARFTERAKFLSKCHFASQNGTLGSFCTMVQQPQRTQGLLKLGLIGAATGVAVGAGYAYHKINEARKNIALEGTQLDTELLKYKPPVTPSRKVSRRSLRDRSRVASRITSNRACLVPDHVPAGLHRFKTHVIPVSDVSFLLQGR